MLLLEPLWVYGTVSLLIACARGPMLLEPQLWGNNYKYLAGILILITGFFVPVENWVLHRHTAWETTFLLETAADSNLIALATLLHVLIALLGYWVSVRLLQTHGEDLLIKTSMWSFSLFFASQGLFHDTLMYPGTYEEFHAGVEKPFSSFFLTERCRDAYLVFFLLFGTPFYYTAISWNSGYTAEERNGFIRKLLREVAHHALIIYSGYLLLCGSGLLPRRYGFDRLIPIVLLHGVCHLLLVLPLYLSGTKEHEE